MGGRGRKTHHIVQFSHKNAKCSRGTFVGVTVKKKKKKNMFCVCNIQEQLLRNRKTYVFNKAPL
jgi:hypothetical protein